MSFPHFRIRRYLRFLPLLPLLLLPLRPQTAFQGACSGLLLWFETLLPTLLPFMVLTDFCGTLQLPQTLCRKLQGLLPKRLRSQPQFLYPLVVGLLSGLPLGAKLIGDTVRSGELSPQHGQLLLTVCNNCSMMFLTGYIATQQLGASSFGIALFLIVLGSSLLSALLCRLLRLMPKSDDSMDSPIAQTKGAVTSSEAPPTSLLTRFGDSIMSSFSVLTRVGGFVILFSVCSEFCMELHPTLGMITSAFLEVTGGIRYISASCLSRCIKTVLSAAFASFTGFSGLAQTGSVLQGTGLSMPYYIVSRVISGLFAALLTFLYLMKVSSS